MTSNTPALDVFWGLLGSVLPTLYLLRPQALVRLKHWVAEEARVAFLYGLLSLLVGLATVAIQPWGASATGVIVSLFGWLSCLKGALLIGWPEVVRRPRFEARIATTRAALVVVALLSLCVLAAHWNAGPAREAFAGPAMPRSAAAR